MQKGHFPCPKHFFFSLADVVCLRLDLLNHCSLVSLVSCQELVQETPRSESEAHGQPQEPEEATLSGLAGGTDIRYRLGPRHVRKHVDRCFSK